jgi:archaeosine synthase alpha-subunit
VAATETTGAGAASPNGKARPGAVAISRSATAGAGALLWASAQVGPLHLETPTILWSRVESALPANSGSSLWLSLREDPSIPAGSRELTIHQDGSELSLRFPIPSSEISGSPGQWQLIRPGVAFVHWPLADSDWAALQDRRPELVVLGNSRALWQDGEPFVRAMTDIRTRLGGYPLLWTPRVALPHRLALLAWLGVDIVDTTEGLWRAATGTYFDPALGSLDARAAISEHACACSSCQSDLSHSLGPHVEAVYDREMAEVRAATRGGRLRELVEARLSAEPALAEMLRYADRGMARLLASRTPVVSQCTRTYVLRESRRRPEVLRFLTRMQERYRPPPSKRILLLVPCSRTKPYRNSPSHRRFARAWESWPQAPLIHVVSVSSPLGLVPRELEDVYPARHYDIPVTGEWDDDERSAVTRSLNVLLREGAYTQIIAHLDPEEYRFLAGALPENLHPRWTVIDEHTTSTAGIDSLRSALRESELGPNPPSVGPLSAAKEGLESLAHVQFGARAGELLFASPTRLEGRPWSQRLTDGKGTALATWAEGRGLFQLTVAGGARILPAGALRVEVSAGVPITGDLFTPGVKDADPTIAPGDAVILVRSGALLGVGEAVLSGPLMMELPRGLAVKVRHRSHVLDHAADPAAPTSP